MAIKIVWMLGILALLGWFISTHSQEFARYATGEGLTVLGAAIACILLAKLFFARLVQESLNLSAAPFAYAKAFWIYSLSQLGKFLPGSIWHFVGRVLLYRGEGLAAQDGAKLLALEMFWLLGSAVAFGVAACIGPLAKISGLASGQIGSEVWWTIAAVLLASWYFVLHAGTRLFVKPGPHPASSLRIFAVQGLIWTTLGVSLWMLIPGEYRAVETIGLMMGAFALGWAGGCVVPFAPAGLGIREAIIVALLTDAVPMPAAIAAVSVHRLLYTVADLVLGSMAAGHYHLGPKTIEQIETTNASAANVDSPIRPL